MVEDTIVIKPGEGIPVDGRIMQGNSAIDQSSITGESMPVEKIVGDLAVAGTMNGYGYLQIKATK